MKPVALAGADDLKTGMDLLLAGYGLSSQTDEKSAGTLRQVTVKTASVDTRRKVLIIATNTRMGGCNGDSGGPAFIDQQGVLKLVGATHGPSEDMEEVYCDKGHGVWTMVNRYQGWMKCTFAAKGKPLASLLDDASSADCRAPMKMGPRHGRGVGPGVQ